MSRAVADTPLLFNAEIAMLYVEPDEQDAHFYRNAQADEVVYVAKGEGTLETQFGDLPYREGDYLVIHRGIMHRYKLDLAKGPSKFLVMESRGHVRWPKRYRHPRWTRRWKRNTSARRCRASCAGTCAW